VFVFVVDEYVIVVVEDCVCCDEGFFVVMVMVNWEDVVDLVDVVEYWVVEEEL